MKDFFVSYNSADRAWAEWIAWRLEAAGYTTVLQAWDFRPGSNFVLAMHEAAQDTERTIAVISPDFLRSEYTMPEWAAAFVNDPTSTKGRLLPVRIRPCNPSGLLEAVIYVDLVDLGEAAATIALLEGIKRKRAMPSSPPIFPVAPGQQASRGQSPFPTIFPGKCDLSISSHTKRELIEELDELIEKKSRADASKAYKSDLVNRIQKIKRELRDGPQLQPGDWLADRYRLNRIVGSGGFAVVWEAYDRQLQSVVALKVLHGQYSADESFIQRFRRGARAMATFVHPAVVRVTDPHRHEGGFHFFAMEFVQGGDLDAARKQGRFDAEALFEIILIVGDALAEAHGRGIVHRDVKPSNILLTCDGTPKLTDFDLVQDSDSTGGTRTTALGTYYFAAPEALEDASRADARSDVYGLAMTAIVVLNGPNIPATLKYEPESVIRKLDVPWHIHRVLANAVNSDPQVRPACAREFCEQLRTVPDEPPEYERSLLANYIENIQAYVNHTTVRNHVTGALGCPDHRLMEKIETRMGITGQEGSMFRTKLLAYIGSLSIDGEQFSLDTHQSLGPAIRGIVQEEKSALKNAIDHFYTVLGKELMKLTAISQESTPKECVAEATRWIAERRYMFVNAICKHRMWYDQLLRDKVLDERWELCYVSAVEESIRDQCEGVTPWIVAAVLVKDGILEVCQGHCESSGRKI